MKKISKILAVIMAAAMMLSICACSDNSAYDQISGVWNTKLDVTQMMNEELAVSLGVDSIDSGDVTLGFALKLTFNDDRTYRFEYDQDAITTSFETYLDWLCDWMTDYMMDMMVEQTGYDEETINGVFQDEYGMSLGDYVVSMMDESVNLDTLFSNSAMESEGYYKLEDGKLYLSSSASEFDDTSYITYVIEDDGTLTISEIVGEHDVFWTDINDSAELPITFTRG